MNPFINNTRVWFRTGTHSNEIGIIDAHIGEGLYHVKAVDKGNKLYVVYLTDMFNMNIPWTL